MTLSVCLLVNMPRRYPHSPVEYSPKIKCALVIDICIITSLIALGILAIINPGVFTGHTAIIIAKVLGGLMIAGGILLGATDALFHRVFAGFESIHKRN